MEQSEVKGLPFHNSTRVLGTIFVPAMALVLFSIIGILYHHSRLDGLGVLALASPAAAIAVGYFRLRKLIIRLESQLTETMLSALWHSALVIPFFGYLACIIALTIAHPH